MTLPESTLLINGWQLETDDRGALFGGPPAFHFEYEVDEQLRSFFAEDEGELVPRGDKFALCEPGGHYVPEAELVAVQTRPGTHLSPPEFDGACPGCLAEAAA